MKWPLILSLCAAAFLSSACEKHSAAELEEATEHGPELKAETTPATEAKKESEKPAEAPKFFPEAK